MTINDVAGKRIGKQPRRAFIRNREAWYAHASEACSITFGVYHADGSTPGEMSMRWETEGPQLRVFDDAWKTLAGFTDVLDKLAQVDDRGITPQEFVGILTSCGFEDITPYTRWQKPWGREKENGYK